MKRKISNDKGVTLVALVITIVILLILASVAVGVGMETVETSKMMRFVSELELMQTKVNSLYDDYKAGRKVNINGIEIEVLQIGGNLPSDATNVFTSGESGITNSSRISFVYK